MLDRAPNNINLIVGGITAMFQPGKTGGFADLGHISSHGLSRTVERGIFESDRSAVKEEVYSWLKKRGLTFEVEAAETTVKNLQMALMADAPALQSQTAGSVTSETVVAKLDRHVRLANRKVSALTLTNSGATVTYVLGTDYDANLKLGTIRAINGGAIIADQSLRANYTKGAMTALYSMNLMQTSRFTGDLIVNMDAENGASFEWYFPSVEVQPKGDLAITTEGPMKTGSFSIKVLKDTTVTAGTEWGTFHELNAGS